MAFDRTIFVSKNIRKGRVLDIGMGPGNLENILFKKDNDVVGIDISKKSIEIAKMRFPKFKYIVGDFLDIKLNESEKFDYVTALEVLEHVSPSKIFVFLNKVKRILNPKGIFIVSVPLNEKLEEMLNSGENPNAHVRVYTQSIIKFELSISGFLVLKEKNLYAFQNNYYLKSILAKFSIFKKHPNNIIIISKLK